MHINPADKTRGVKAYNPTVGKCYYCKQPTNLRFDIGTPILVLACRQSCADMWWNEIILENLTKETSL